MELVNNKYVKFDKFDLCYQQIKASETRDECREVYFNKIMRTLLDYEREKKRHVPYVYVSRDNHYIQQLLKNSEITITRQTILNAIVFALLNNEIDVSRELAPLLSKSEFLSNELGKLLDYVLDHSIDINEYFDGEEQRIIYNDRDNCIEKGYVYETEQLKKNKQLKLK